MRIHVKADGHNIRLAVPTAFLFSRASVWLWLKIMRLTLRCSKKHCKHMADSAEATFANIPDQAVLALCAELMRVKRKHKKWDLVEVATANGEQIHICL